MSLQLGPDNREATVRIASGSWGKEIETTNLEFKPSDPTNNPYLALGVIIAAGIDGMENKLKLPKPLLTNPSLIKEQNRHLYGIKRYPETLDQALENLNNDSVLTEAMGKDLTNTYLAVKNSECKKYSEEDEQFEAKNHFYKY